MSEAAVQIQADEFVPQLIEKVKEAIDASNLPPLQKFFTKLKLRRRRVAERVYDELTADALDAGTLAIKDEDGTVTMAVDWNELFEQIIAALPKIIEIIKLFM